MNIFPFCLISFNNVFNAFDFRIVVQKCWSFKARMHKNAFGKLVSTQIHWGADDPLLDPHLSPLFSPLMPSASWCQWFVHVHCWIPIYICQMWPVMSLVWWYCEGHLATIAYLLQKNHTLQAGRRTRKCMSKTVFITRKFDLFITKALTNNVVICL